MTAISPDTRSPERKRRDEQLAEEAERDLTVPQPPPGSQGMPLEYWMKQRAEPVAVDGIVVNGVVRPVDPSVKLKENMKVLIVTTNVS